MEGGPSDRAFPAMHTRRVKPCTHLHQAGRMPTSDAAYQRGVKYLLSSQFPDGSWHVKSRAVKFQPYFESGFPHGHDQWISAAGTAWAASALALTVEPSTARAQ